MSETTIKTRDLFDYERDAILMGYPWACACGEMHKSRRNAVLCRKCREYLYEHDSRREPQLLSLIEGRYSVKTLDVTDGDQHGATFFTDDLAAAVETCLRWRKESEEEHEHTHQTRIWDRVEDRLVTRGDVRRAGLSV